MPIILVDGVETEITQAELDAMVWMPPVSEEYMRDQRNTLLAETDWWANSDVTMTDEQRAYRQALRDIPQQEGFPTNITWPTAP